MIVCFLLCIDYALSFVFLLSNVKLRSALPHDKKYISQESFVFDLINEIIVLPLSLVLLIFHVLNSLAIQFPLVKNIVIGALRFPPLVFLVFAAFLLEWLSAGKSR